MERPRVPNTLEAAVAILIATAGGADALPMAQSFAKGGLDVEAEARWFADRGVLGLAAGLISASNLPSPEKIEQIRKFACQAVAVVGAKQKPTDRDRMTLLKARAVIEISAKYLNAPKGINH